MANGVLNLWDKVNPLRAATGLKWEGRKANEAERDLRKILGVGAGIKENYKGENLVNLAKIFLPGPLKMIAHAGDYLLDKRHAKQVKKRLQGLRPDKGKYYGDYLSQGYEDVLSQVKQAGKSSVQQSLVENILGIVATKAFNVAPGEKNSLVDMLIKKHPGAKDMLHAKFPQLALSEFTPGKDKLGKLGGIAPSGFDWFNILQSYLSGRNRDGGGMTIPRAPRRRQR